MSEIKEKENPNGFITWGNTKQGREEAMNQAGKNLDHYRAVGGRSDRFFRDVDENVSVRPGFTRLDYEYFRPDESVPREQKAAIAACMKAYEAVGIIKNVVDLMGDFACQGITLVHPNPRIEKFYQDWFKKVEGKERSERFLNLLYRTGNVIVKRSTGKLKVNPNNIAKVNRVIAATPSLDMSSDVVQLEEREIPWRYIFYSPLSIEVIGEELSAFVGKPTYGLVLPTKLRNKIKNPKDEVERELVAKLPEDIRQAAMRDEKIVMLDQSKLSIFHYKKDDWQVWAYPMTYAILNDIIMYDKLKLTDISACDSAISAVRLWRLGSLEHKIMPREGAIEKLSHILGNHVHGGSIDLVWGPDVEFIESKSEHYKYLGEEKYKPTLNAIYAGLGIPPTLTGSATSSGFTNNYISLKTLTERLSYGRSILTQFWESEIRLLQKAMGFKQPATLRFERMTLSDEAAEKALLIQLVDRDIISEQTLLERFDEHAEIEKRRIKREFKNREKDTVPDKAGPYHKPDKQQSMKESFVNQGIVSPSEVGVNLKPRKKGEKRPVDFEVQKKIPTQPTKQKGRSGQGRPKNSKDSGNRKTKVVKPRSKAMTEMWAKGALNTINSILTPAYLNSCGKKNLRGLTDEQSKKFESIKLWVLCQHEPFVKVDVETVNAALTTPAIFPSSLVNANFNDLCTDYVKTFGSEPTVEELRILQIMVYSNMVTKE